MTKNKISKYFLWLSILTLAAVFFVVVQKSYENLIKARTDNQNVTLTRSISPNLDLTVLDEIENREEINVP